MTRDCYQKNNNELTCSVSWQLTDDELSFGPRQEAAQLPKQRQRSRPTHAATASQQITTPVVPNAPPTFAMDESDSDVGMKDDDGEYTGEHQLTRLRRGKQVSRLRVIETLITNLIGRFDVRELHQRAS